MRIFDVLNDHTDKLDQILPEAKNYAIDKWPVTTISASGTTTRSISITTHGNPVFLLFCGDLNPNGTAGGWCTFRIYRENTELTNQITQSTANSQNNPFSVCWLDTPPAGTHTYKSAISWGSGTCQFGEASALQSPQFVAFELGVPYVGGVIRTAFPVHLERRWAA